MDKLHEFRPLIEIKQLPTTANDYYLYKYLKKHKIPFQCIHLGDTYEYGFNSSGVYTRTAYKNFIDDFDEFFNEQYPRYLNHLI